MQTERFTDRQIIEAMAREAAIHARNLALLAHPDFVRETLLGLEQQQSGQAIPLEDALKQLDQD